MRLSSLIRDSTKVSVVTVDVVRGFDVFFACYWWCIGARCANSLFFVVSSAGCRRLGLVAVLALCSCRYLMGVGCNFEVDRVLPSYGHCRLALVGFWRVTLSSFSRFLFLVSDIG